MTDTAPFYSLDPTALLSGDLTPTKLDAFRAAVFQSVDSLQQLRDWLSEPRAKGTARGIAMWALGRHEDAVELLAADKQNAVVACCLASSLGALGRIDEAAKLLGKRDTDAAQALVWLRVLDANNDAERLAKDVDQLKGLLSAADVKYYAGRALELARDVTGAIAAYDDVLGLDNNHKQAMFRLALNVDLRGEDEEARELYERALMSPPVTAARCSASTSRCRPTRRTRGRASIAATRRPRSTCTTTRTRSAATTSATSSCAPRSTTSSCRCAAATASRR
jgi:tetratricopeptide (TPR) repeat protein